MVKTMRQGNYSRYEIRYSILDNPDDLPPVYRI